MILYVSQVHPTLTWINYVTHRYMWDILSTNYFPGISIGHVQNAILVTHIHTIGSKIIRGHKILSDTDSILSWWAFLIQLATVRGI